VAIVNSVKCVPPQNKPIPQEIATCTAAYFRPALAALPRVRVLVALGKIAHDAAVRAAGAKLASAPFGHLAEHRLPGGLLLVDSYHCSRYNQNTNRLTREMFEQVFARAIELKSS
jgi:uracil-DNA glycosylase